MELYLGVNLSACGIIDSFRYAKEVEYGDNCDENAIFGKMEPRTDPRNS